MQTCYFLCFMVIKGDRTRVHTGRSSGGETRLHVWLIFDALYSILLWNSLTDLLCFFVLKGAKMLNKYHRNPISILQ